MSEVVNKKQLADFLVDSGLVSSKKHSMEIIDGLLGEIVNRLADNSVVDLYGFGKFEVVERAGRMGKNPSTGETIEIEASRNVKFKAAKAFKESIK